MVEPVDGSAVDGPVADVVPNATGPPPRAVRPVAAGEHEQHGQVGEAPADVRAQRETRPVGAVQVFGHEQHRAFGGRPFDEP